MRSRRIFLKIIFLAVLFLTACFGMQSFRGEVVGPSTPAAEIDLPDHNGNNVRLSEMRGNVVLVFFGFTNCVDECPLTMAHIKLAMDSLGEHAQDVRVVLISTDPVRDTPHALKEYLGKFDSSFVGIPGTVDSLKPVWAGYSVVVEDAGETHSSLTYMIDKSGNLRVTFNPDTAPEDIAHDIETLLAE